MCITDSLGYYTHLMPMDKDLGRVHITLGNATAPGLANTTDFSFDVYRRFPNSDMRYDFTGLHVAGDLFTPKKTRSFSGSVKTSLETILSEAGVDETEVSSSLNYSKQLVQPNWTNGKYLNYLKENLVGKNQESCFYTFMKCVKTKRVMVFKCLRDFVNQTPKYNFAMCDGVITDQDSGTTYYPILGYSIQDNYGYIGTVCGSRQESIFYDHENAQLVFDSFDIDGNSNANLNYPSLTKYFLVDKGDDPKSNITLLDAGRTNDFDPDFRGRSAHDFHKNVTNLCKLWIDTLGLNDVYPGDIVQIHFLGKRIQPDQIGYQHQGYWMVEKVVHVVGRAYMSRLLLTRNGTDSSAKHNLVQASTWKGKGKKIG